MKAFLLAAGHGTRLRPYTQSTPKCLLPVCGVPMLQLWMELCKRHGITSVLVNTHAHADAVIDFARNWKDGVELRVAEERELQGSAGTLRVNREWVSGEDLFWVFYADVLTNLDLTRMQAAHQPGMAATVGLYSVPDPERCGIATVDSQGIVTDFVEKPKSPSGNLAFAGILLATPEFLEAVPEKPGADIAFDVMPRLLGQMHAYRINEYVLDIGTRENYEAAQKTWPGMSGEAEAHHGN